VGVVNSRIVETAQTASAAGSAAASTTWRDLPEDVRRQVKIGYPARRLSPDAAQAALWWARRRRLALDRAAQTAWSVVALAALWMVIGLASRGVRAGLAPSTTLTIGVVIALVALCAWTVCAVFRHAAIRVEAAYLVDALPRAGSSDAPAGSTDARRAKAAAASSPTTVNWRHNRTIRALRAGGLILVGTIVNVGVIWLAARDRPAIDVVPLVVVQIATAAYVVGRWLYAWPWPVASSYPHLVMLDEHELRIHPLALNVPWHRVNRVRFEAAATGVALVWQVDDPAAIVADAPISPAQQRRLLRWLTANGGAIRLTESQMLESPEAVYAAAETVRNGRLSAFRLRVPSPPESPTAESPTAESTR
jgi:hypothetical protein